MIQKKQIWAMLPECQKTWLEKLNQVFVDKTQPSTRHKAVYLCVDGVEFSQGNFSK